MSARRVLADDPQVRRAIEAGLREKQRAKLRELRQRIKDKRASKRAAVKGARLGCKLARRLIADECATKRARARETCAAAIDRARKRGESEIDAALAALADERALQASGRRLAKAQKATRRAAERTRRLETDDMVKHNIPAELHVVYDRVKRGLPKKERSSRTEVFLEWAAEHEAEVAEIQAEADFAALAKLEREERKLARELRRPRGRRSVERLEAALAELDDDDDLSDIPF
jgi:hypothetical protein